MLQGVDLNQVKQYNASLKQYKDKAASLNAEIEYTNKEIDALCAELTTELGIQVTRDNIQQIYEEQVSKINSTLQSGNAVLAKIASEEQAASTVDTPVAPVTPVAPTPVMQTAVPTPVMQTAVPTPVMQTAVPTPPVAQETAVAGSVFGTASPTPATLPPLFNMGN